jgi:gliding motility-associated-like protein
MENVPPSPQIAGSSTFCAGSSTTLDAGDYVSYMWSVAGEIGRTIDVNTSGDYSVTVTDANNCTGIAMIRVDESSELEPNISGDTVLCIGSSTTLDAGAGFDTYLWSGGQNTQTIVVTEPGDFSVDVSLGTCMGTGMVSVTANTAPRTELQNTFEICNTEAAGSILNFDNLILSGDDTGVWENVDMIPTTGSFPFINFDGVDVGIYDFSYTTISALSPCTDTTYTIQISVTDCDCPSVALDIPPGLCNDDLVFDLNSVKITSEPGTWVVISVPNGTNPATVTGDGTLNIENADPGSYRVQFQLDNPEDLCPETNSIQIDLGLASFAGTPLDPAIVCVGEDDLIDLTSLVSNQTDGGMWIETSGNMSTGGAFDDANATFRTGSQIAGTYTFAYVIDATAPCEDDMAMVEVIIENVPVADAGDGLQISCGEPEVTIGGPGTSTGSEFNYTWTDSLGNVIGSSATINVDAPGIYRLDVVNTITTCTNFDSVEVTINPNTPSEIETDSMDPRCFGSNDGLITVLNVVGGTPPFVYSIDGGPFVNTLEFGTLSGGPHTITILDDAGCMLDKEVILTEPEQSPLELGPDIFLILGDSANLNLSLAVDISEIANITWSTPNGEISGLSTTILVKPSTTTNYTVVVEDLNGCISTDQIKVIVSREINVFVPNAFTPNGDNINDLVIITANAEIEMIKNFQIFDRWGELLYSLQNFPPNDPSIGWDGTLNGKPLNPQVFIWTAEVQFRDPLLDSEIISGDITLIR